MRKKLSNINYWVEEEEKSIIELFSFFLEAVFLTIGNQDDMIIEDYGWIMCFVGSWEN